MELYGLVAFGSCGEFWQVTTKQAQLYLYPHSNKYLQPRAVNAPVDSNVDSYKLYLVWKIKRLLRILTVLLSVVVVQYQYRMS